MALSPLPPLYYQPLSSLVLTNVEAFKLAFLHFPLPPAIYSPYRSQRSFTKSEYDSITHCCLKFVKDLSLLPR